jgi:hypothetical protein
VADEARLTIVYGRPGRLLLSVTELNVKIRAFITGWNDRSHPFVWTKTAEQVLAKANPQKTSKTNH